MIFIPDGGAHAHFQGASRHSGLSRLQSAGDTARRWLGPKMRSVPPCLSGARRYSRDAAGRSNDRSRVAPGGSEITKGRMSNGISDSVPRLKRWLPRLRGKRIGVLGDLMLDRYLWGTASRLSPEAAVPVVDFVEQSECLGGAGNVAVNIAALGGKVEAFGVIGTEEAGRAVQKCLRAANIVDKGVVADPKRITTVKTRIIARHQQVVRVDHECREPLRPETQEKLLRLLFFALRHLDALVLSDYDKGLITDDFADRVLSAAHQLK